MEGTPRRLVVADDNVWMAQSLKILLELWGFEVTVVHDGQAALDAIRGVRPEAALLDLRMGKLDGREVARRVRAEVDAPPVRLIAVTGLGTLPDPSLKGPDGFDVCLLKPIDADTLRGALR